MTIQDLINLLEKVKYKNTRIWFETSTAIYSDCEITEETEYTTTIRFRKRK